MTMGNRGENLIFLISQMRGGSTLLQNILGNHPDVHTLPEPWIALPTLYAMYSRKIDKKEYKTEYNPFWARTAVRAFVQRLPKGDEDYLEGLRRAYSYWYECAMAGSKKRYFLDKGPRYYLIIPELMKVFPDAKFIILLRNPLAVLTSINSTWMKNDLSGIHQFKHDLLKAPRLLLEGITLLGNRCIVARYEELVKNPEQETRKICEALQITFAPEMLNYTRKPEYENALGYKEQKDEYRSGGPDADNADKWITCLRDPRIWRLSADYLRYLGRQVITDLGYSYDGLKEAIDKNNPGWIRGVMSPPLLRLIKRTGLKAQRY